MKEEKEENIEEIAGRVRQKENLVAVKTLEGRC